MPPADSPRAARGPARPLWQVLKPLASLQLTVVLFACSMVLVFFGTLAQQTTGLWDAVYQYFWSWVVMVDLEPALRFGQIFLYMPKDWVAPSWAAFPWPGGKLIGGLMFVNLLAAHLTRFKFTWKRVGVIVSHSGLLLLAVGEYITREFQVEQRMVIREGEAVNYSLDHRNYELAFTRPNPDGTERTAVIPEVKLRRAAARNETIRHPDLPCDVRVNAYYTNSALRDPKVVPADQLPSPPATGGLGVQAVAVKMPDVSGVDQNRQNMPSLYVTFLKSGTDEAIGTYLLSTWFDTDVFNPEERDRQAVAVDGVDHDVELRAARYYKPFSLHLTPDGFRFDKYTGTKTAKNYSSDLLVIDPDRGPDRPITVRMNDPLRHRGETFYQADFDKRPFDSGGGTKATVLQVVRNPGWLIPYIACAMVTLGLLFHFLLTLVTFLAKQARLSEKGAAASAAADGTVAGWSWHRLGVPLVAVAVGGLFMASKVRSPANPGKLDLTAAANLAVVDGGRVKPLDSVARVYLRKISGREEYVGTDGDTYPAIKWLMDCLSTPQAGEESDGPAGGHRVVRIDNDQVRALLDLPRREGARYSLKEIDPKLPALLEANQRYDAIKKGKKPAETGDRIDRLFESGDRDVFGGQLAETFERVDLFRRLCQRRIPLLLPPTGDLDWRSLGDVEGEAMTDARVRVKMFLTGQTREQATRELITGYREMTAAGTPADRRRQLRTELDGLDEKARLVAAELYRREPGVPALETLFAAYRAQDKERFDAAVRAVAEDATGVSTTDLARAHVEVFLNNFAPAYHVMYLYVLVLFVTFIGWAVMVGNPDLADQFRRAAFWLTVVAFLVHTFALVSRMYVSGRWFVFVTNLYSSAVFIGWAAVAIGLLLERTYRLGLGNALAASLGGSTAIIAHNLAASGDTLEMMQAVLDTNFWLAIHVTTVTFGYSATYAAGLVGALYVVLGVFTPLYRSDRMAHVVTAGGVPTPIRGSDLSKDLGKVIYGIVCLATLFSFFGTVSGGIWADQSWGRFWGWDPKENGAVLIVIWNALILHARWCGLVKERGMAVLALVGNMVTTWSWFGTNQLGVGLHAYGFSKTLAAGCTITWLLHLGLIGVGCMPKSLWFGFSQPRKPA